jgi:hypothetical protein
MGAPKCASDMTLDPATERRPGDAKLRSRSTDGSFGERLNLDSVTGFEGSCDRRVGANAGQDAPSLEYRSRLSIPKSLGRRAR